MVQVIVVYKKTPFHVDLNPDWTVSDLKETLYKLTKVAPFEQKLFGLGGQLEHGRPFKSMRIKENQKLLLVGSDVERTIISKTEDEEPVTSKIISKEIQLLIFSYLGGDIGIHYGVGICMQVCKKWNTVVKDQFFWYTAFQQNWNLILQVNEDWQKDWRLVYERKWKLEQNWKMNRYRKDTFYHSSPVRCLARDARMWHQSPRTKTLASGSGNIVHLWDVEGRTNRQFKGHKCPISCLEISGGIIVSGDTLGNLLLWDLTRAPEALPWSTISGELVSVLPNVHKMSILSIKFDDDSLASSSADGIAKVWDLNRVCLKYKFGAGTPTGGEETGSVPSIQLNGNDLFTASMDGTIKLWDLNTGKCQLVIKNEHDVSCIQLLRSYDIYSSSKEEDEIKLWDLRLPSRPILSHSGFLGVNHFDYDGAKIVAGGIQNVTVGFLSPDQRKTFATKFPVMIGHHQSLAFMDSFLAVCSYDGVSIFDYDV